MVSDNISKNKITINILILVLLTLVSTLFSVKLTSVRNGIIDKKQQLVGLQNDVTKLDQIVADKVSEEENIQKVLNTLPQTYFEVGKLAYKVEGLAVQNNLKTTLGFDKDIKLENGIPSLKFEVNTESNFQNFSDFLSSLNALPYNSVVDLINMENKTGVSATTTIKVYTKK